MKNFLVVRNDKIGDFMLAWPAIALLKQSCGLPNHGTFARIYSAFSLIYAHGLMQSSLIQVPMRRASNNNNLKDALKLGNFDASLCLITNACNAALFARR